MVEYRRGVAKKRENAFWHWHPVCEFYPTQTFAIRKSKPLDEDICPNCAACAEDSKPSRSAA